MIKSLLTVIALCLSAAVFAQDQTINGDLYIGSGSHDQIGYGKRINFMGNTDNCFITQYNIGINLTEFRFNMGDDLSADDRFVVGVTNSVDGQWYPRMSVGGDGMVGFSTNSPRAHLDMGKLLTEGELSAVLARLSEGNTNGEGTFLGVRAYRTQADALNPHYSNIKSFSIEHAFYGQVNSSINFFRGESSSGGNISFNTDVNSEKMRILANGNIGIGTSAPDSKLSVNGTIHSKEVKIDMSGWPDYVFKTTYKLPSLKTLKAYIDKNKHLPDIPSETEVAKDGVNLGEMNKLLLKIEEWTIYLIEKDKQIQFQQKQIDFLYSKQKLRKH